MKIKKYYVPQVDQRDCGVAALATVFKFYNSTYPLAYLRNLAKTNKDGTTCLGLVKAAEKLNFNTNAIMADKNLLAMSDITYPFIVQVNKNKTFFHFYVVFNIDDNYVYLADPDPNYNIRKMDRKKFLEEWTGVTLFLTPNSDYKEHNFKNNSLGKYSKILFKNKRLIIKIVSAAILTTVIGILGSYYLQLILDKLIPNKLISTINLISIGLIVAYVTQQLFTFVQEYLLSLLGNKLSSSLVLEYVNHILKLPMSFFATRRTGEILSRFTDSNKIIDAMSSTIMSMFLDVFIVITLSLVLMFQSYKLFFITLILIPLYSLIIFAFYKPFEKYNNKVMESNAKLSSSIIEDINGIETIKSLNAEKKSYMRLENELGTFLSNSFTYNKLTIIQKSLKTVVQLLVNVCILWVGSDLVISNNLSVGQLITYNALLSYFTTPIQNIINLQTKLQSAKVSNNRLNEIYLVDSEFKKKRTVKDSSILAGDINIKNMYFSYGYEKTILNNINLSITNGESVAFLGMSGSGKTTLAKLITGYYDFERGTIDINNTPINNVDRHVLRNHIKYIPQNPYLFDGTIMDNLLLGVSKDIKLDDIRNACDIAQIKDYIESSPYSYDTELSENGTSLSGGQKQRITIARALLSPAKVLIFDESTSAIDTITEEKIIKKLLMIKDKTIIFVAHRLNIAKKVDHVVLMDDGKIIGNGCHKYLIKNNEKYKSLFKL